MLCAVFLNRKRTSSPLFFFLGIKAAEWVVRCTIPSPPLLHTHTGRKMAALLLLLLGVGALFFSSNAQEAYNKLPETYRKGVDLALEKLNSHAGIQHHFLFLRSVTKSDIEVLYSMCAFLSQCLSVVVL